LIVPGGSAALAASADMASERATQLAKIAGRGALGREYDRRDRQYAALRPWQRGLLAALGLSGNRYASAPVCARDYGESRPGSFWMHLEPVHFVAGLDRLNLLPLTATARLTHEERESLRTVIAVHLREWNLQLHTLTDGSWLVRAEQAMDIVTTCPEAAASSELDSALPSGKDAGSLRRLMTEMQMLLHDHPVNQRRTRTGLPVVNALWPWGSGIEAGNDSAHLGSSHLPVACGDLPYLRGIYRENQSLIRPAARDCAGLLESVANAARVIAVVEVEEQSVLEDNWVAPLVRALAAGRLARLDLVLDDWHLDASRSALRRFWRKALPPSRWAA
jgi:hypothetical protein